MSLSGYNKLKYSILIPLGSGLFLVLDIVFALASSFP